MKHLIASHQSRPTDDPIFSLAREAADRAKRGETIVNATLGVLLDDDAKLAVLPTAARAVREVSERSPAICSRSIRRFDRRRARSRRRAERARSVTRS
jgi:hypothetical protein